MNIPTLMTVLGARGTGTPSAVAGAELPGTGEKGFACLVQMLLTEQQTPTSPPAVPQAEGSPTETGDEPAPGDVPAADGSTSRFAVGALPVRAAQVHAADVPVVAAGANPVAAEGLAAEAPTPDAATADAPAAGPLAGQVPRRPGDVTASRPTTQTGPDAPADTAPVADVAHEGLAPTQVAPLPGAPVPAALDSRTEAPNAVSAGIAEEAGPARPAARGRVAADGTANVALRPVPPGEHSAATTTTGSAQPVPTNPAPAAPLTRGGAHERAVPAAEEHATLEPAPAPPQPNSVTATASAVSAQVHGPGSVSPQAGHAQAGGPVGGQVFPEVVRLVTRGDGTQRLTLRLSPENLGEVRIVVTVRDGAVGVSLSAGAEAQEALLHGSGDLRRLLEGVGAASTQIVVRDLPATTAGQAGGQPFGSGTAATYADGGAPGREHQRDGRDPQPHAADGRRHTDVGTHPTANPAPASAAGVDLRL